MNATADYRIYHQNIQKAERFIFMDQKIEEGLKLYSQTFHEFDFVFAGDCVTALQIALYNGDKNQSLFFAEKAFKQGVTLSFLNRIDFIKQNKLWLSFHDDLQKVYKNARQKYLHQLDTSMLHKVIEWYALDQLNKNGLRYKKETSREYLSRSKPIIELVTEQIQKVIRTVGIPSDRLIGIDYDSNFYELGSSSMDLWQYYHMNKHNNLADISLSQFQKDHYLLASTYFIPIMIHSQNVLSKFDTNGFFNQIVLGNLHPKDYAFLLDNFHGFNRYRLRDEDSIPSDYILSKGYYGVSAGPRRRNQKMAITDSALNSFRAKLFIAPIEQDRTKWDFLKKYGMKMMWGYMGCRS